MEREQRRRGKRALLSAVLRRGLNEALQAGQQSILFLNRRGFATLSYCFACGNALRCSHCDIALVYHAAPGRRKSDDPIEGELRCHYCGYAERPQLECRACGSREGGLLGFGTERLAEEVAGTFPHARVARLDRDTSARRGAQRDILAAFHRGEIDVLVGTQMIAKGHDVPNVTLVGVVAADLGLHFPDFRAAERTFQLLTQVAGRAGRGDQPGRVVIQTWLPRHYAIRLASAHDFPNFYREELARREPHGYPPFRSLVHAGLSGARAEAVERAAHALAALAKELGAGEPPLELLGPAPAPLARIRDEFRWQLLLLGERERLRSAARELARRARPLLGAVRLRLDASPLQML
jgi:primosomal protein N' (replication factor Y)